GHRRPGARLALTVHVQLTRNFGLGRVLSESIGSQTSQAIWSGHPMVDERAIKRWAEITEPISFGFRPDLRALERAIGDARIVLLGEQNHGDGATFMTKARIVEHLHYK